jgi:hypothetical protein
MSIEHDLERGAHAKRLLDDTLLTEAFNLVRQALLDKWEASPLADVQGQKELRYQLHLLASVRANLELALSDGNMAADKLRHINRHPTPAEFSSAYR